MTTSGSSISDDMFSWLDTVTSEETLNDVIRAAKDRISDMYPLYLRVQEENEWEGETWVHLMATKYNSKQSKMLESLVDSLIERTCKGFDFDIVKHMEAYDEYHNTSNESTSYMAPVTIHNKGYIDLEELISNDDDDLDEALYKGGITDYFVKQPTCTNKTNKKICVPRLPKV
jgi:hypothetical protein